ncbi:MAG: N-acetylmuramoyl-L-alanine amidase [Prevotella sp.]|nr:N-acetylmuramoyl-L-alanine amidase [Prevotella sp.]MBQ9651713.1 N-acetylmuramoyl-L-alanine amidase [Prevotella sp.]
MLAVLSLSAKRYTLVIDAGHGGHDAGACGAFSKEKNINLNVALAFGRYVERNCPDVNVVYTRKTDVFIPLNERANIANRAKADLFISVHTNALPAGRVARGFEVYTLGMHRAADNLAVAKRENSVILVEKDYKQRYEGFDPNSSESYIMFELIQDKNMAKSVELARMIQQEVCASASRPNKGVHQAGFLVLRATSMPSCLVELGFITTSDEESLLNSKNGIDAHARGLYNAFVRYRKKHEGVEAPKIVAAPTVQEPSSVQEKTETSVKADTSVKNEPSENPEPSGKTPVAPVPSTSGLVFKVQIMASDTKLKTSDRRFKGEQNIDSYFEKGLNKYTIGASSDYNEIVQLRKSLLVKFPEAFIIAFKNGEKMDIHEAIREFKQKK